MSTNLTQYASRVSKRTGLVNGLTEWNWINEDSGAFLGPLDDWITSHNDLYTKYLRGHNIVVQAGGNCGMYPLLFSKIFDAVYTFEPDSLNFYTLVQNCQVDTIIKMQAALGDVHKMVGVHWGPVTNVGMHTIKPSGIVPQLRIDDLDLPFCDLIQLDIEGYEFYAIRGAVETIKKFRPVLALETVDAECKELLTQFSYIEVARSRSDTILIPEEFQ